MFNLNFLKINSGILFKKTGTYDIIHTILLRVNCCIYNLHGRVFYV